MDLNPMRRGGGAVAIVVATRNRARSLERTLDRLATLPERPPVVVVDNGSADGTAAHVRAAHPEARVIELAENRGGAARVVGARDVECPYVAFSDDDSWWAPGALARAVAVLDEHPRLAVLAARVLVGPEERLDPACAEMARSALPAEPDLPGPAVLGFVACGSVVRRTAFLAAGAFHPRYGIGGEEELLALDLATAGWGLAYVDQVVAHHHPAPSPDRAGRRCRQLRNALWSAWLRSPLRSVPRRTVRLVVGARHEAAGRGGAAAAMAGVRVLACGVTDAVRGLPWVLRERRSVPPRVDRLWRALD